VPIFETYFSFAGGPALDGLEQAYGAALYCSSGATLNLTRQSTRTSTRLFEAAARGPCITSDTWAGVEAAFEPETEVFAACERALDGQHEERRWANVS
jgi:hypothetical protein